MNLVVIYVGYAGNEIDLIKHSDLACSTYRGAYMALRFELAVPYFQNAHKGATDQVHRPSED